MPKKKSGKLKKEKALKFSPIKINGLRVKESQENKEIEEDIEDKIINQEETSAFEDFTRFISGGRVSPVISSDNTGTSAQTQTETNNEGIEQQVKNAPVRNRPNEEPVSEEMYGSAPGYITKKIKDMDENLVAARRVETFELPARDIRLDLWQRNMVDRPAVRPNKEEMYITEAARQNYDTNILPFEDKERKRRINI
ncbi:hypothetical protein J4466_01350 [Candidatus Pacearchaeota archaeon]|nr:hypothetical protein [Candidatus Pacearchaeota archaeon]